ncbi:kyphoscoliosis peptidase-like [Glandiceps talaboti]
MGCASSKTTVNKKNQVKPILPKDKTASEVDKEKVCDKNENIKRKVVEKPSRIEDTFWEEKKKLIPNYERMRELDRHAVKASQKLKNNPEQLISYLTSVAKNDLEKIRVIFRWEAENTDYDVETYYGGKLDTADNSPEGALKNGLAVCAGYSGLLKWLCFDKGIGKHKYSRKWNEAYFLSEPNMFASKHFPVNDNGQSAPDEQLLDSPVSDLNVWSDTPVKQWPFFTFNLETISHDQGIIEAIENEALIKVRCPDTSNLLASLKSLSPKGKIPRVGNEVPDSVMTYFTNDIVNVKVRLPSAGNYVFDIFVPKLDDAGDKEKSHEGALTYTIKGTGSVHKALFPPGADNGVWGCKGSFINKGFQILGFEEPIIITNTGRADVMVKLPNRQEPLMADLVYASEGRTEKMSGSVCGEHIGDDVHYHIVLPHKGEYRFTIWANILENDRYQQGANYLIQNSTPADVDKYPDMRDLWGPNEEFYKLGLQESSGSSSTVLASDGTGQLTFKKEPEVEIIFSLLKNGKKCNEDDKYVFADPATDGSEVTFYFRLPETGYYSLQLFAKNRNNSGSYPGIGCWLLESRAAWKDEFYPTANGNWGAADHFVDLGLQLLDHKSSLIKAENGSCILTIKAPKPITTTPYLERNGSRLPENEKKKCIDISTDDDSITYTLKELEYGFYKFKLYGALKDQVSLPYLGSWLIQANGKEAVP